LEEERINNLRKTLIRSWTITDVGVWLKDIGLSSCCKNFETKMVDGETLIDLVDENINDLELSNEHKSEIFSQRAKLQKEQKQDQQWNQEEKSLIDQIEALKQEIESQRKCEVCHKNDRNTCFSPCMHISACKECASSCKTCPTCKRPVKSCAPAYLA